MICITKTLLFIGGCIIFSFNSYAQLDALQSVQESRFTAKKYLMQENYDSAYFAMSEFIDNAMAVNPFDYLSYALCNYKRNDTTTFLKYLDKAIESGIEQDMIRGYLRKLTGTDKDYLDTYLNENYLPLHKAGWIKYDTALINEVISINKLDQLVRDELTRIKMDKVDSNYNYLFFLGRQADSINYQRVVRLFESGKYPGYHNCGAIASYFSFTLMHITDGDEKKWQYIFTRLKTEVVAGNISPDEVATIADRHYKGRKENPCSYYGHSGKTTELCDCQKVDKYRAAIGLESLKEEYELLKQNLPECYQAIPDHKSDFPHDTKTK